MAAEISNRPNEKWLTYVAEFKLLNGKKAYLSAILDLHDKSIVAYALGRSNNNQLVFDTFDRAVSANPSAHPLFHSDRGCQYTNRQFKAKLDGIHAKLACLLNDNRLHGKGILCADRVLKIKHLKNAVAHRRQIFRIIIAPI